MACVKTPHKSNEDMELSPALVKEAIEGFNLFDKTKNNGLDIDELGKVFRALGQNPSDAELRNIMKKHDINANGLLDREEFEKMILSYMKPQWKIEQELKDAFRIFDRDGSGTINADELEYVLKRFGEPLTHRQSKELISLMDKNDDGKVDVHDFVKFLCEVDQPDFFKKNYPGTSLVAIQEKTTQDEYHSEQQQQQHQK